MCHCIDARVVVCPKIGRNKTSGPLPDSLLSVGVRARPSDFNSTKGSEWNAGYFFGMALGCLDPLYVENRGIDRSSIWPTSYLNKGRRLHGSTAVVCLSSPRPLMHFLCSVGVRGHGPKGAKQIISWSVILI